MKIVFFLTLLACVAAKKRRGWKACCNSNKVAIKELKGKLSAIEGNKVAIKELKGKLSAIEDNKADIEELERKFAAMEVTVGKLENSLENLTALIEGLRPRVFSSCKELFEKQPASTSGVYKLLIGSQEISVYCQMGNFGCGDGGWTPVMKTDGTKNTFGYDSSYWVNKASFNLEGGKTGFDRQETKLPSYSETSFTKICLGMKVCQESPIKFIVIDKEADSLYSLIADEQYRATSLGRDEWKKLMGSDASLQANCNMEGFNVKPGEFSTARIGVIANQENNCDSCDSRIGFGTGGHPDESNTCGNAASHGADNGDKAIKAMGYILVQ